MLFGFFWGMILLGGESVETMEIRRLSQEDFYALRALLDRVFTKHNGRPAVFAKAFPRLFGQENDHATASHLGAFVDGRLVGTAAMYPLDYMVGGVHIRLIANGNVAVDEDYRGQGVMSALLRAINEECDRMGDVCYLHGSAERYGRFGYLAGGVQYVLTVAPGEKGAYTFRPMEQADVPALNRLSRQKPDYVLRQDADFIPALCSGGREAVTVLDGEKKTVGYLSYHREKGHVEEYAFASGVEARVFPQLAGERGGAVTVTVSGYDPAAAQRCEAVAEIRQKHPALFRVIHPEKLQEAAIALGLDPNVFYAPYLT